MVFFRGACGLAFLPASKHSVARGSRAMWGVMSKAITSTAGALSRKLMRGSGRRALLVRLPIFALIFASAESGLALTERAYAASSAGTVTVYDTKPLRAVPQRYIGFSIDPANLCYVVQLAQTTPAFVQLFRNLGPGTFRIGGNTGDKNASWSSTAPSPTCRWNRLVMTPGLVRSFFAFAQQVGYRVIWQVPLNNGEPRQDAAEAAYVSTMPDLYSIEIGNEPNYYYDASTDYQTYIDDWATTYRDYIADDGEAPVTGPAATVSATFYINPFLDQHATDVIADTGHWYAGTALSNPTCSTLLQSTSRAGTAAGVAIASTHGLPFIMNETNTYTSYGMSGVSNAYCSALWAADYTLNGLAVGASGMYFHGTADYPPGNSHGQVQYYTPITQDGTPAPEYYGMLFYYEVAQAGGSQVAASIAHVTSVDAYAVAGSDGKLRVALVNRGSTTTPIVITTARRYGRATEISLTAPALDSLSGVRLGKASVASDGTWTPVPKAVVVSGKRSTVTVPAYVSTVVTYSR